MLMRAPNGATIDAATCAVERLERAGFAALSPKGRRPNKAELLAEAEEHMTNPELYEAVEKAKKSPAKPRRKKA